ncbi:hypothetical protein, partial [uncultured Duncaniella sp.]
TYKDTLFRSKNHPTILQLGNKWSVSSYHFTISLKSGKGHKKPEGQKIQKHNLLEINLLYLLTFCRSVPFSVIYEFNTL